MANTNLTALQSNDDDVLDAFNQEYTRVYHELCDIGIIADAAHEVARIYAGRDDHTPTNLLQSIEQGAATLTEQDISKGIAAMRKYYGRIYKATYPQLPTARDVYVFLRMREGLERKG